MTACPPLFVGGCRRSGTTLVRTMLNAHPDLAVPHETFFMIPGYRARERWGDLSRDDNRVRLATWVATREEPRAYRLSPDRDELMARMVAAPPTLGSVLSAGFRLHAERQDKPCWGVKQPGFAMNLDAVFAMFPDARYVHIVRDPRAAAASIRRISEQPGRRGWYGQGLTAGADLWQRCQRAADRWRRRLPPEQFHEIQYEQLLEDPEAVLGDLARFSALEPSGVERMLAFHEKVDIPRGKIHALLSQPLTTEPVRKWERELTREEIALVERVAGDRMSRYGYEPVASGVRVPSELTQHLRRRQRGMQKRMMRRWVVERKRRVTYRYPVAAVRD
jgi:hypothetical protein